MSNKNEVFEYLIDALRHQVNNNPYKQRCEDLAHEVLATATGDVEAYKLARKGGYIDGGQRYVVGEHGAEQSGCRKEDTQECEHEWRFIYGAGFSCRCTKCGALA